MHRPFGLNNALSAVMCMDACDDAVMHGADMYDTDTLSGRMNKETTQ